MLTEELVMAAHFAHTRWRLNFKNRARLETWQQIQLGRFLRDILPSAPRYQGMTPVTLADLPTMDKASMMENFASCNTRGVQLDQAIDVAQRAEESRDFSPMLGDLTVGLSSGTSGNRGVFLVSKAERVRWAGILLARALPQQLLAKLLTPWQPPLQIAFFLRANSNLYTTLNSRRLVFAFYDLLCGVDPAISRLNSCSPDILVGPPSLLRALAFEVRTGRLHIRPKHVISVAEVLEKHDADSVRDAFGCVPHQLYQATEGLLAYTCEHGTLHLNETFVHIEPEWLDKELSRFQPIITDFTRQTQLIVRYRLNDVLRVANQPCPCGRAERSIAAIEGRSDEIIWLPECNSGRAVAIYPDMLRRAMLFAGPVVREYTVTQSGMSLQIALLSEGDREIALNRVKIELDKLWQNMSVQPPTLSFFSWKPPQVGTKRCRIYLDHLPERLSCAF